MRSFFVEVNVDVKWRVEILKQRMTGVFLRKNGLFRVDTPVDAERTVGNGDATVGLGMIVVVAFVLEYGCLAQYGESVGESAGHEELQMIFLRQLHGHMAPVGRRTLADVDGNVEHPAAHAAHEFALGEGRTLEMQAAHHAARRARLVVLHEIDAAHSLVELAL